MRNGYIYGVRCTCHPEQGTRYVGQTVISVASRRHVHLWNSRNPSSKSYRSHFSNWIRLHTEENTEFFVLEETTEDEIDEREDFWISHLRSEGAKLTNIKSGGGQARGHKRPPHAKDQSGENNPMYGRDRSEIMAYVRSFQGPVSEETKSRMSASHLGSLNSRAVLDDDAVRELRKQEKRYGLFSEWARTYGVSAQTIYLAYNRKTWKHVTD